MGFGQFCLLDSICVLIQSGRQTISYDTSDPSPSNASVAKLNVNYWLFAGSVCSSLGCLGEVGSLQVMTEPSAEVSLCVMPH